MSRALGRVIVEQRRAIGLSQEALAFQAGLHRTYVSEIERGIKSPTIRVLFDLARPLRVPPSELLRRLEATQRLQEHDEQPLRRVAEKRPTWDGDEA